MANTPIERGALVRGFRDAGLQEGDVVLVHSALRTVGLRAEVITQVDPALPVFDLRSSFGVMLACNTQVLLLGVTYSSSTSHHFAEWVCDVPYRHAIPLTAKLRRPDGSLVSLAMTDYQPKPSSTGTYYGTRHTDFNRLGRMLEGRGQVGVAA